MSPASSTVVAEEKNTFPFLGVFNGTSSCQMLVVGYRTTLYTRQGSNPIFSAELPHDFLILFPFITVFNHSFQFIPNYVDKNEC